MNRVQSRRPQIIVLSGQPELETVALDAGADRFVSKPISSIAAFQALILGEGSGGLEARASITRLYERPSRIVADLRRAQLTLLEALLTNRPDKLSYGLQFIRSVCRMSDDANLTYICSIAEEKGDFRQKAEVIVSELGKIIGPRDLSQIAVKAL